MQLAYKDAVRLMERFADHEQFCRESLEIRNKQGVTVDLRLSPAQRKLSAAVKRCVQLNRPVRIIALKARQVHMSVGAVSEFFKRWAFIAGQKGMILGHDHKSASNLFGYLLQFYEGYRPFGRDDAGKGGLILPGVRRSNRPTPKSAGYLELENNSVVTSQSAETVTTGRSESIRHLLLSELAFYTAAEELFVGLMQSVPDDTGTTIIKESTPNGLGNLFHRNWLSACDPAQDSAYLHLFFGCHEHPEYRMPVEDAYHFQRSMTDEEHLLLKQFNIDLPLEFLQWRRWAIREKCEGSVEIFHQEYAMTPEEAFLASGRPRFDMIALSRMPVRSKPAIGELEVQRIGTRELPLFTEREDGRGVLQVWERPRANTRYVVGCDTAEGKDAAEGVGTADPDYSCGQVLDADTGDQVAMLRGRLTPGAFGRYLNDLGRWFNSAYLVVERNGPGLATIETLITLGYPLERMYQDRPDSTHLSAPDPTRVGFTTSLTTRPRMLNKLDEAIRLQEIIIRDPITISECRTFVIGPSGKAEAQEKCHDDTVMALALAVVGIPHVPVRDLVAAGTHTGPIARPRRGARVDEDDDRPVARRR